MKLLRKVIIKVCILLLYTISFTFGVVLKSSAKIQAELIPLEKKNLKKVNHDVNSHEEQRN